MKLSTRNAIRSQINGGAGLLIMDKNLYFLKYCQGGEYFREVLEFDHHTLAGGRSGELHPGGTWRI